MSGRQYPEWLGQLHFWTFFIGANLTFFPQHFLGLAGMPRRIPDYPDVYAGWNYVSSIGSYIGAASALIFLYLIWHTFKFGKPCPDKQWDGGTTLEWTLPSPPPFHTFEHPPVIK